MNTEPAINVKL